MVFAGFDEAGRGPMAGPVVAACVILPENFDIACLADSKKLTASQRERAYTTICETSIYGIGISSVAEIDLKNIFQASMLAMSKAYQMLQKHFPQHPLITTALIDGHLRCPYLAPQISQTPIVKGDTNVACIAAASILAKVTRDRMMEELDQIYPHYQFAKHKGYGTLLHRQKIAEFGRCPEHRKSFLLKHEKVGIEIA